MNKRPLAVTLISGLFVAAGLVGLVYHATEFKIQQPFDYDLLWIALVRLLAIVCGVFVFRGSNWARWLLLVWIAYHVFLSLSHSMFELVTHALLLAVVAYFLLRPQTSTFFLTRSQGPK